MLLHVYFDRNDFIVDIVAVNKIKADSIVKVSTNDGRKSYLDSFIRESRADTLHQIFYSISYTYCSCGISIIQIVLFTSTVFKYSSMITVK